MELQVNLDPQDIDPLKAEFERQIKNIEANDTNFASILDSNTVPQIIDKLANIERNTMKAALPAQNERLKREIEKNVDQIMYERNKILYMPQLDHRIKKCEEALSNLKVREDYFDQSFLQQHIQILKNPQEALKMKDDHLKKIDDYTQNLEKNLAAFKNYIGIANNDSSSEEFTKQIDLMSKMVKDIASGLNDGQYKIKSTDTLNRAKKIIATEKEIQLISDYILVENIHRSFKILKK